MSCDTLGQSPPTPAGGVGQAPGGDGAVHRGGSAPPGCPQSAESWERLVQEQREGGAFPLTRWGEKGDPSTSSPQHTNTLSPPPSPAYLGQQLDKQLTQKSCVFAQELLELQLKPVGKCFNLS